MAPHNRGRTRVLQDAQYGSFESEATSRRSAAAHDFTLKQQQKQKQQQGYTAAAAEAAAAAAEAAATTELRHTQLGTTAKNDQRQTHESDFATTTVLTEIPRQSVCYAFVLAVRTEACILILFNFPCET